MAAAEPVGPVPEPDGSVGVGGHVDDQMELRSGDRPPGGTCRPRSQAAPDAGAVRAAVLDRDRGLDDIPGRVLTGVVDLRAGREPLEVGVLDLCRRSRAAPSDRPRRSCPGGSPWTTPPRPMGRGRPGARAWPWPRARPRSGRISDPFLAVGGSGSSLARHGRGDQIGDHASKLPVEDGTVRSWRFAGVRANPGIRGHAGPRRRSARESRPLSPAEG